MVSSALFGLFVVTAFANIVTPGMTNIVMMTLAAECGWKKTIPSILATACALSLIYAVGLSALGIVIAESPILFAAIKLTGVFFLLFLARQSFRKSKSGRLAAGASESVGAAMDETPWVMFKKGFIVTLTNPQPIIFALTVFPQFIDPDLAYWPQVLVMLGFYLTCGIVVKLGYVLLADRLRALLLHGQGPAIVYRTAGFIFVAIACIVLLNIASGFL